MKRFKKIDFTIQLMLLVYGFTVGILYCVDPIHYLASQALLWYLVTGGWQLLSFFLHRLYRTGWYPAKGRNHYRQALLILLAICLLSIPVWPLFGFFLLFSSPLLAIWYTYITYREVKLIEHQELVHLK